MFSGISDPEDTRPVSQLSFREKVSIMHTGDKLTGVDWLLDSQDHLLPSSFCDKEYMEQAFNHDAAFFLRLVGGVNSAPGGPSGEAEGAGSRAGCRLYPQCRL